MVQWISVQTPTPQTGISSTQYTLYPIQHAVTSVHAIKIKKEVKYTSSINPAVIVCMGQTSWIQKFQWLESKVMNNDSYNANHNFSSGSTCLQNPVSDMAMAITHKQTVDVLISPAISSAFYT